MEERENYMITYGSTTLTSYNTITKIEVYYYKSTSATSLSGGSWSTTKPTWENGKYIWQKIRTTYEGKLENGQYYSESNPVNITGQQGATGTAAYSYNLTVSDTIVSVSKNGTYSTNEVTFSATSKQGSGTVNAYSGRFKIEATADGITWIIQYTSSADESSKKYTIPNDISNIRCSLYQAGDTTVLLDIVSVSIVKDGADGALYPNLSPFFSHDLTDIYDEETNPNGYWMEYDSYGWTKNSQFVFTQLEDGWLHVHIDNSSGTATIRNDCCMTRYNPSIKRATKYTFLAEFRNNQSVGVASGADFYLVQQNGSVQFWGQDVTGAPAEKLDGIGGILTRISNIPSDGSYAFSRFTKYSEAEDSTHWTTPESAMVTFVFRANAGAVIDYDVRLSLYEGEYWGNYVPYIISDVTDIRKSAEDANYKIDNLEIGGRNYILNTSDVESSFTQAIKEFNLSEAIQQLATTDELTISFWAKASENLWIDFYFNNGSASYTGNTQYFPQAFNLSTEWAYYTSTDVIKTLEQHRIKLKMRQSNTAHGNGKSIGEVFFKQIKLEYGNKATDWTPAPEDVTRGTGFYSITTAPTAYTTEIGGFTPTYRVALSTVKSESGLEEVMIGDVIQRGYNTYPVGYVDDSYVYLGAANSIRGATGAAGLNNARVILYRRFASTPSDTDIAPTGDVTYTFSTGVAANNLNSWSQNIPSGTNPVYMIAASASSTEATDTIPKTEWSAPIKILENGQSGGAGTDGYNQATIFLYQRKSGTAPTKPSAAVTYTFSSGALSSTPTGWSRTIPVDDGNPCYVTTATAVAKTATYSIPASGWSDVVILSKDGVSVTNVTSTNNTSDDGTSVVTITLSDGTTKTFNVKNGSKGSTGATAEWYYGTDLTHTSGTATLPASQTDNAVVGSMYLNTETSLVYKCTAVGTNNTWIYAGDLTTGVINNIEIGGRNLLRNTANVTLSDIVRSSSSTASIPEPGIIRISPDTSNRYIKFKVDYLDYKDFKNQDVTVSFDARLADVESSYTASTYVRTYIGVNVPSRINYILSSSYDCYVGTGMYIGDLTTEWKRFSKTWTIPDDMTVGKAEALADGNYVTVEFGGEKSHSPIEIRLVKFEKGNVPTNWTPAPEDIETELTELRTDLQSQIDEKIQTYYQSTAPSTAWTTTDERSQHDGDLWYYTGETTTTYTKDNVYRYNSATNSWATYSASGDLFDKVDGKSTIYYGTPSGTYTGLETGDYLVDGTDGSTYWYNGTDWAKVTDYQTAINSIEIGGRNYFALSTAVSGYIYQPGDSIRDSTANKEYTTPFIPVTPGEKWSITTWVQNPADQPYYVYAFYIDEDMTTLVGERTMRRGTAGLTPYGEEGFTVPATANYMRASFTSYNDTALIKLEKGTKATDWSPAPEDVTESVTQQINDIEIGGRNLLLDSGRARIASSYYIGNYVLSEKGQELQDGDIITFTMKARISSERKRWAIYNSNGTVSISPWMDIAPDGETDAIYTYTGEWKTVKDDTTADNTRLRIFAGTEGGSVDNTVYWAKLERGNKATDWTAAPEDVDVNIQSAQDKADMALAQSIEYIVGTQTASTSVWTGTTQDSELKVGKTIAYKLPYASTSTAATLNLTLADGMQTGAKPVYMNNNTAVSNQYAVNTIIQMTYDGTAWKICNYNTNTNTVGIYGGTVTAGANGIRGYTLVMKDTANTWVSITTSAGAGSKDGGTGTNHVKYSGGLYPDSIMYESAQKNYEAGEQTGTCYLALALNLRYSTNCGTTLVKNTDVYLVGTIHADGLFYLDSPWWTQTIPGSEDGKVYIKLGLAYSTYQIYLAAENQMYEFYGGRFMRYEDAEAEKASKTATNYMSSDESGIMVADMSNGMHNPSDSDLTGSNVYITAGYGDHRAGVHVRDGLTDLAYFGETVELGRDIQKAVGIVWKASVSTTTQTTHTANIASLLEHYDPEDVHVEVQGCTYNYSISGNTLTITAQALPGADMTTYEYDEDGDLIPVSSGTATEITGETLFYVYVGKPNMALVIGNGTSDNARSNAFEVDWDGGYRIACDTSSSASMTDQKLYAAIQALGWESEVITI